MFDFSQLKPGRLQARLAAAVLSLVGSGAAPAQQTEWQVKGRLMGGAKNAAGTEFKKSTDVSGIACTTETGFPRICLIVDDESPGAQIVIMKDGEMIAGDFIQLIAEVHTAKDGQEKLAELDAEAVAYSEGAFYVTGSHGRPRKTDDGLSSSSAKAAMTRRLFRIVLPTGSVDLSTGKLSGAPIVTASSELEKLFESDAALTASFDAALAKSGLGVEGLAVTGNELHIGLRSPVLDGCAVMVTAPLDLVFSPSSSSSCKSRIQSVDLGRDTTGGVRGIRDLVAYKDGFLIIAGPMLDPDEKAYVIQKGDYTIYRQVGNATTKLLDLDGYVIDREIKVKPEALLPLDEKDGTLRALILFDGPMNGAGRTVAIPLK